MTRINHISDTHGHFPKLLGTFDVVVHSGDASPNFTYNEKEASLQMLWWEKKVPIIKTWLQGRPFLFTLGNHDFLPGFWLEDMLNSNGIKATCLHDKITTYEGINFYGFPYVPPITGKWEYELTHDEMAMKFEEMAPIFDRTFVDVIVAHCPPYNYLDLAYSNNRYGNTQMNTFLDYQISRDMQPSYYLCGHIHEANGLMMRNGMLISNAAVTQQIIEM